MKFLLELVPCFGHHHLHSSAADDRRVEETRSLMRTPSRRRKKRARSVSGGAASAEWRPSLTSISEDMSPTAARSVNRGGDERKLRRRSIGGSSSTSHVRGRNDDLRRSAVDSVIPVFSPTPFMF